MAREFNGTTQYLERASAVVTGNPMTMACWFNSNHATSHQFLLSVNDTDHSEGAAQSLRLLSGNVEAVSDPGSTAATAITTTGYSTSTWHHGVAVFASTTDRRAFLDGGNKGTNTSSQNVAAVDNTTIGVRHSNNAHEFFMDGIIAEAAVWSAALTDEEVAILALGFAPRLVRPQSLVAYWPLIGRYSPEIDPVGGFDMTLNNAPTVADHPRMLYGAALPGE